MVFSSPVSLHFYNRENETSSILKTKRAKALFFSLPFFSQKRTKNIHLTLIKDLLKEFSTSVYFVMAFMFFVPIFARFSYRLF